MSALLDYYDRSWTPDDFKSLPDDLDWRRVEILDGMLVVSPPPARSHERLVLRLGAALLAVLPDGHDVIAATAVAVGRSYHVTDLTVLDTHGPDVGSDPLESADVLVAIEIESPSSITTDRITKPAQYAAAGIPFYWRLETDPLRLVTYALRGGAYVETRSYGADDVAAITEPFAVTIDLGSLVL